MQGEWWAKSTVKLLLLIYFTEDGLTAETGLRRTILLWHIIYPTSHLNSGLGWIKVWNIKDLLVKWNMYLTHWNRRPFKERMQINNCRETLKLSLIEKFVSQGVEYNSYSSRASINDSKTFDPRSDAKLLLQLAWNLKIAMPTFRSGLKCA